MNIISNIFRSIAGEQTLTDYIIPALPALIDYLVFLNAILVGDMVLLDRALSLADQILWS